MRTSLAAFFSASKSAALRRRGVLMPRSSSSPCLEICDKSRWNRTARCDANRSRAPSPNLRTRPPQSPSPRCRSPTRPPPQRTPDLPREGRARARGCPGPVCVCVGTDTIVPVAARQATASAGKNDRRRARASATRQRAVGCAFPQSARVIQGVNRKPRLLPLPAAARGPHQLATGRRSVYGRPIPLRSARNRR